jgi:Zn-dependent peptidase ImmA (M78 family)
LRGARSITADAGGYTEVGGLYAETTLTSLNIKSSVFNIWRDLALVPPVEPGEVAYRLGIEYYLEPFHWTVGGMYLRVDQTSVIAVNSLYSVEERRIIGCHEIGHHLLHNEAVPVLCFDIVRGHVTTVEEQICERFAIEMALPDHLVIGGYMACKHLTANDMIRQMCRSWGVGHDVMYKRLRELGLRAD